MKYPLLIALTILACHRVPVEEKLRTRAESWIGKSEVELVQAWGMPKETGEMKNYKILAFEKTDIHAESYRVFGRVKKEVKCIARFSVDTKTETVKSGSWEGDERLCERYIKAASGVANDIAAE